MNQEKPGEVGYIAAQIHLLAGNLFGSFATGIWLAGQTNSPSLGVAAGMMYFLVARRLIG